MLKEGRTATRLPAQDLERARPSIRSSGLDPVEERPGGLRYECASGEFALFASAGGPSGDHTQMGWEVDDIEATAAELRSRGVVFEEYDLPGFRPSTGSQTSTTRAWWALGQEDFETALVGVLGVLRVAA
jgi:hypothetical protein